MEATINTPDGLVTVTNKTLVEETDSRVYIENENKEDNDTEEYPNATLISVSNAQTIGYVKNETENIIDNAEEAEQISENKVLITLQTGESTQVEGTLDRAYTY